MYNDCMITIANAACKYYFNLSHSTNSITTTRAFDDYKVWYISFCTYLAASWH